MSSNPQTQEEWAIHSINIHGTFFERWCRKTVSDSSYWELTATNYPVEFPPSNGPLQGKQSSLDIRADHFAQNRSMTLLIECKKNNPELIHWVFFQKYPPRTTPSANVFQLEIDTAVTGGEKSFAASIRQFTTRLFIADEGRETRGDYIEYKKQGKKTKTSNAAIDDAAFQVALATRAIALERTSILKALVGQQASGLPSSRQRILPIIVTTAELLACDFSPEDVDCTIGEIGYDKAHLRRLPYLLFEYTLPCYLQAEPLDSLNATLRGSLELFKRLDIVVVNGAGLADFLRDFEAVVGGAATVWSE